MAKQAMIGRQVGLYLEKTLHEKIVQKAADEDRSLSSVARMLFRMWLSGKIKL